MAINSKFIHRNLAMDQLHAICKSKDIPSTLFEGNISQSVRDILLSCHFEDFDMVFSLSIFGMRRSSESWLKI